MKKLASLTLALAVAAEPAFAQVAGGGGGAFQSVYQWFMTNVWAGVALFGVVAIGVMVLAGRFAWMIIAALVAGGLIIKYAPDIAALIT
jgi:type IV secretory pathway VirB2 component (pilin)